MSGSNPQKLLVAGVFTGVVPTVATTPVFEIETDECGIIGSRFYGKMRFSKTKNRLRENDRQWSAVYGKELRQIITAWNALLKEAGSSVKVGTLLPEWLGPNVLFEGEMEGFSQLIPGTRFQFDRGPVFVVTETNLPCEAAASFISSKQAGDVHPPKFIKAAMTLRGLVGTIEQGGLIRIGDLCEIVYPDEVIVPA